MAMFGVGTLGKVRMLGIETPARKWARHASRASSGECLCTCKWRATPMARDTRRETAAATGALIANKCLVVGFFFFFFSACCARLVAFGQNGARRMAYGQGRNS